MTLRPRLIGIAATVALVGGIAVAVNAQDVSTSVVHYRKVAGESLDAVAAKFGTSAACIRRDNGHGSTWNPPNGDVIHLVRGECPPPTTTTAATTTTTQATTTTAATTTTVPPTTTTLPAGGAPFPSSVSANHRYLLDQFGRPYLMQADSNWCLINQLTTAQADTFYAARQSQGFNASLETWSCGNYEGWPSDGTSFDGSKPFINGDIAQPTPAYWARFDAAIASAKTHGIEVIIDTDTGSWLSFLSNAGATRTFNFGVFLGNRYKAAGNVSFIDGNDYGEFGRNDAAVYAIIDGIRSVAPNLLESIEMFPPISTSYDSGTGVSKVTWATDYSYFPTYDVVLRGYNSTPTMPNLFFEGNYENEDFWVSPGTTTETIRRQIYWALTSGAAGQFYGNQITWQFRDSQWPSKMTTPAVAQDKLAGDLFRSMPWQDLAPDATLITSGRGTYDGSSSRDVLNSDYATATRTQDGAHAVVYVPTGRTLTVDTSKLAAGFTARWFDPTTGASQAATGPTYTSPAAHADGARDWVLVFTG